MHAQLYLKWTVQCLPRAAAHWAAGASFQFLNIFIFWFWSWDYYTILHLNCVKLCRCCFCYRWKVIFRNNKITKSRHLCPSAGVWLAGAFLGGWTHWRRLECSKWEWPAKGPSHLSTRDGLGACGLWPGHQPRGRTSVEEQVLRRLL